MNPVERAEPVEDGTVETAVDTVRRPWLRTLGRLGLFVAFTFALAYGSPTRLATSIPGDPGDAYLILSLLEWGADRARDGFAGYWAGPMFATGRDVMAYTDTFLPLVIPFGLLEWLTGSRVLAFNLLYVASWVLCCEATYRLARRFIEHRGASVVTALAFTFCVLRLTQTGHFQLAWAGLIPLTLLAFFWFRDRPNVVRGVVLALVVVAQFLTSAYYGLVLIVAVGALVGWHGLQQLWRVRSVRPAAGHAAAAVTLVGLLLPVRHWYASAEACAVPRIGYAPDFALRPPNLLSVPPQSTLLADAPVLGDPAMAASWENHAYVGAFVLLLVPVFAYLVVRRRDRLVPTRGRLGDLAVIGLIGLASAAVAAGKVSGVPAPYDLASAVIPGVDSILALARLFLFFQLALVLAAGVALAALLERLRPRLGVVVVTACALVIGLEGLMEHRMIEVVSPAPESVHAVMTGLEPGVAVELPMQRRSDIHTFALVDSTRMVLGTDDDVRTVNGYSGYAPRGYDETVDILNTFPSAAAVAHLRSLGVDYVVLHSAPVVTGDPGIDQAVAASGVSHYEAGEIEQRLGSVPEGLVQDRLDAGNGVVLSLTPGPRPDRPPACPA